MTQNQPSVSPADLYAKLGTALAPALIDVRRAADFAKADTLILSAFHENPDDVARWAENLPKGRPVVVYCVHGHQVSQGAAAALRAAGFDAAYLDGGIAGWIEKGLPTRRRMGGDAPAKWITREHPKIDRIACPWLIRRFIDPRAEFIYVPTKDVVATAKQTGGIPYDIDGVEFTHEGERCSFDTILRIYGIADPALDHLATIVRGADTSRHDLAAQCGGLFAISLGLSANFPDDHEMLSHGMVMYDALYTWCRTLQAETHNWPSTKPVQQAAR
ncbi:MAG TPA: chromate resistance protein ChrB domain-containing protein [Xanthobacteraceae bacterium]|jgi:rhodanese-related sulfurtransferase|nr:chromate resistance protein ChrB domain-containing protein [Xanthobacteraceae bacterium]